MSTAVIKCLHTEVWPLSRFVPHPRNPNRHPKAQIDLLAKIIVLRGWRRPIVVSSTSGFVVKGHGRLAAAIAAGLVEAPVEIQSYASEVEEIADMVADNRIAELSEMDGHALREMLAELDAESRSSSGFSEDEFQAMLAQAAPPADADTPTPANVGKNLRFGNKSIPLSDQEFEALKARGDAYRETNGTSYGFARAILGMP